jgi:predicted nucleic acid-binding protein
MGRDVLRVVVSDTNILINLCIAGRLGLLAIIPSVRFVVPREVQREMQRGRGRRYIGDFFRAVNEGYLEVIDIAGESALAIYSQCVEEFGLDAGESAGLALAIQQGWLFATVEVAAFERASFLMGQERVVHLEDILELAVAFGLIRAEEREQCFRILEQRNHYRRRG